MKTSFAIGLFLAVAAPLSARIDLLLVPPLHPVSATAGLQLTLYLNNPTEFMETVHLPAETMASYAVANGGHGRVHVKLANPQDVLRVVRPMARQTVTIELAEDIRGTGDFLSLRLEDPVSNAIMVELAPPGGGSDAPSTGASATPAAFAVIPGRHIDLAADIENVRRHISAYEPIYFALGGRDGLNARFQFSFRYRLFERGPRTEFLGKQLARDLYFAYTQTSIWDLESFSKPFYDTSYKPTIFLLRALPAEAESRWRFSLQTGTQHESNGKGGGGVPQIPKSSLISPTLAQRHPSDTRSLNTVYIAPKVHWKHENGLFVEGAARVIGYFQIDENPDIARYRGNVDLTLSGGYDRGFQASLNLRGRASHRGSAEFNFTWPAIQTPLLKYLLPRTLGGYAQVQYFNGYGESLLDYDVRRRDQLRFGFTIVR